MEWEEEVTTGGLERASDLTNKPPEPSAMARVPWCKWDMLYLGQPFLWVCEQVVELYCGVLRWQWKGCRAWVP